MAGRPGAGTVSGYHSHGPERRGDAAHAHPSTLGGTPMVRVPFRDVKPLGTTKPGSKSGQQVARRFLQQAMFDFPGKQKKPGPGIGPVGVVGPGKPGLPGPGGSPAALPPGPGMPYNQGFTPHGQQAGSGWGTVSPSPAPAYGGAAYNGGGGPLATAISGSGAPAAVRGGPYKALPAPSSPGERVSNRPPTSMRQSQAGRSRRAANFRASHNGPRIIQGRVEPPEA